ncbi:MAG: hypothetical protein HXX08_06490 [Chloroflexi bacterium]|uniref:Uncharacterized protein n=1 Tax=Candidatus Chlorohelix allophototropha TaxID=3003348 RepID=A0A8T7LTZ1_9CHLR|nr:hypothetical protein [Chloroflexota bacterium]WJW67381.1 hypothetical protein OZ401_000646 [Chloroflexota bacterium L227-S17]
MKRFSVNLSLLGLSENEVKDNLSSLIAALSLREYLYNPKISWDREKAKLVAILESDGLDAKRTGLAVYDDFFETIVAVIHFSSEDGITLNVDAVKELN